MEVYKKVWRQRLIYVRVRQEPELGPGRGFFEEAATRQLKRKKKKQSL